MPLLEEPLFVVPPLVVTSVEVVVVVCVEKLGASASFSVRLRNQPPTPRATAPRMAKNKIILKMRSFHSSPLVFSDDTYIASSFSTRVSDCL